MPKGCLRTLNQGVKFQEIWKHSVVAMSFKQEKV